MSSFAEQRTEVMKLADHVNTLRQELLSAVATMNMGIARLVQESERLLPGAVEEGPAKHAFKSKNPSPVDVAEHEAPSRVHCGNCGGEGHTIRTCTEKREEKVPEPKVKKKRKPLTEEQRKAKIEILKKAREVKQARKGGK